MSQRSPRIAVFSFWHGPGYGAERVLEYLLEGGRSSLRDLLVVVAPVDSGVFESATAAGYCTVPWPAKRKSAFKNDLPAVVRFLPTLKNLGVKALHAWHTRGFEFTILLGMRTNLPVVGTMHDHPHAIGYGAARRFLMRWGAHHMEKMACVSDALRQACEQLGWTVPLYTIRNGLPDAPVTLPGADRSPLNVAFLGAADPLKGREFALELVALTDPRRFVWNFYGAPPPDRMMQKILQQLPGDRIRWKGRCPPASIYAENDVVFHPSPRFDCYPTVLLEAARSGLPSIATNVGGTLEIVTHSQTGFIIEPGGLFQALLHLEQLANDPELRDRMAISARRRFEQYFGVQRMIDEYTAFWTPYLEI